MSQVPSPFPESGPEAQSEAAKRAVSSATTGMKIRRVIWAGVEGTLFRWSFHNMYGWRALLLRCFGARVGQGCRLRRTVRIYYPWNLVMGEQCIVGDRVELYSLGSIVLQDRSMISQEAYICTGTHDLTVLALPLVTYPIVIGQDAWVCARAFIGPNVTIGEGAVVAAGAVVARDVEPWAIVGGNPAKFIKQRELRDTRSAFSGGEPTAGERV